MTRAEVLKKAKEITVDGKRAGEEDLFDDIAKLWGTYLGHDLQGSDVCMLMILLKVARVNHGRSEEDSLVDIAGYASCAAQCLTNETAAFLTAPN